ncbi:MAG TPA: SMP-30/gluconolactonase/LRE family protein [Rhizomicrobium sp.]
MSAREPECVWPLDAELGEGPVWSARERALWFVDIKQKKIHRYDATTGDGRSWDAPAQPGFLAPLKDGSFIAGLQTGLHRFHPESGAFTYLYDVEPQRPGNRLNDGAVDPRGRLWFGSMDDAEAEATGCLYRLDSSGPRVMDTGYVITNGPTFSPDGKRLYHTDTLKKIVYAFDLDEDGAISNKRVFTVIEDGAGHPDGPCVDSEGCVWTGLFAGWSARRYAPTGELLETVRFPCANITKLAFGGPDLKTAYATTAWKGMSAEARIQQPLAGALFRFQVDVPGLPQYEVAHG